MQTTHESLHLDNWSLVLLKIVEVPTRFIWIIVLFDEALNMAMVRNFEVMLGQTPNHSVYNSVILCIVSSL
jgi:hypothetical protein